MADALLSGLSRRLSRSSYCTALHGAAPRRYCECFASGKYCDACNCLNCFNNREHEDRRQFAIEGILERNPNAFRPKIQVSVQRGAWTHELRGRAIAA